MSWEDMASAVRVGAEARLPDVVRARAVRVVAANAVDPADAALLLDVLGFTAVELAELVASRPTPV